MNNIENKVTSLVITVDDVVKEVSLPNTRDNIAFELVLEKFDTQTVVDIVTNDSAQGLKTERLAEYREWYAKCKDAVKDLDMTALNTAANKQIEAERLEAEKIRLAEEEAFRKAEEARKAEEERIAAEEEAKREAEAEERRKEEERLAPMQNFNAAKAEKLTALEAYDKSSNVNSYSIGGIEDWKTAPERTQLITTVNAEKADGKEETVLWLGLTPLTLNCDLVLGMLMKLEVYAHECYNVTAQHKANITAIEAEGENPDYVALKEQIEAYDFTVGYPEKLAF